MLKYIDEARYQNYTYHQFKVKVNNVWDCKMKLLLCLLLSCMYRIHAVQYGYNKSSEVLRMSSANGSRIRGAGDRMEKDFLLGGLFPIHLDAGPGRCGDFRLQGGLERMEAMLYALDLINSDETLLPNITLGYDIRDTCYLENIGLDEALDLVITGSHVDITSCQIANNSIAPILGIVGAAASRVSVPVAGLCRLFSTPQVSYSSTSNTLSNRENYNFFYRTISSDTLQARAMIDLMLHFNWTYISTIHTRNAYGQPGIDEVHALAAEYGICIDLTEGIDDDFTDLDYQMLTDKLINSQANVVVVFTAPKNAEELLSRIHNSSSSKHRFTWIASNAWAMSHIVYRFNETAAGLFGIIPVTQHLNGFHEYASQLTVKSNQRNPWFPRFYFAYVKSQLNDVSLCDESPNLTCLSNYQQGPTVPLVIDAVYTFAHALQDYLTENCEKPVLWYRGNSTCRGQKMELNGSVLLEYIAKVKFDSPTGNSVSFDKYGNPSIGVDDIVNYRAVDINGVKQFRFEIVGRWYHQSSDSGNTSEALHLNNNVTLQFGISGSGQILLAPSVSTCGQCALGEYRKVVQFSCCSLCQLCLGSNYSDESDATSCKNCSMLGEMWGNNPLNGSNGCIQLPETRLDFSNALSIVNVVISSLGMILTAIAAFVFSMFWNTPFIKASGREQMVLLLTGVASSFISAIIYVSPPSIGVCILHRCGLWFSFSLMFGALLLKVTRVARIFLAKWPSRLRFATPRYQILFTVLIVLAQMVLVGISIAQKLPNISRILRMNSINQMDTPSVVVMCVTDPLASLVLSITYQSTLISIATVLGVLSFKYPANFNEAKFIAFCTLALLAIWIFFIPPYVYFTTQSMQEFQSATISLAVNMSALSLLVCMFGPKIYLVSFHPEKNTKRRVNDTSCSSKFQSTHAGSEISIDATKANTAT